LRASLRPCNTTSWPWPIRSRAAMRPRPSDDPVMNTRATAVPPLVAPTVTGYDPERSPCSSSLAQRQDTRVVQHVVERRSGRLLYGVFDRSRAAGTKHWNASFSGELAMTETQHGLMVGSGGRLSKPTTAAQL